MKKYISILDREPPKSRGLRLLKTSRKGLSHAIFSRFGLYALMLLSQAALLALAFYWFAERAALYYGFMGIVGILNVLIVLRTDHDWTARATWCIFILLIPVFGVPVYWYTRTEWGHRMVRARVDRLLEQTKNMLKRPEGVRKALRERDPGASRLAEYLKREADALTYSNTKVTYFPLGEEKWQALLEQLERAEHYIFMEYFIVDEGEMWGSVLEILARKVKEGVDVRLLYDGSCEFALLPHDYPKRVRELGIKCKVFAPVRPLVSTTYNYRDHRKIAVIDGHTAFTGGVNLADEYINRRERFGHWKDVAVMLQGEAAQGFSLLFLQMWNLDERTPDFSHCLTRPEPREAAGFVVPYGDCPLDGKRIGERVYMDLLNRATDYVHIMTPYLLLDGEMETALRFAAERGVDVRIILPGIPDKKAVYALAKTHYPALLSSGVKIYEYTPGFVHAKVFVCDGREATVGTINLDYRSLYHHFECGTWMYETDCVKDIEADFEKTLEKCREITPDTKQTILTRIVGFFIKPLAPLL